MSYTIARFFVDTNILIYSLDASDPEKRQRCRELLDRLIESGQGVVSYQVLHECTSVMLQKMHASPIVARRIVNSFARLETVSPDLETVHLAIDLFAANQLSFWDGLIIGAAKRANCDVVLTEDMNHGQVIEGVRIHNPFVEMPNL